MKYLGTIVTSDGKCETEIKSRIGQAKAAFQNMSNIFRDRSISQTLKMRLLQCYIEPILTYSCETWTLSKQMVKRIEAIEMWFLRRMFRIKWTDRKTNMEVMEMAEYSRSLEKKIRNRQAKFIGHVMRRKGLENLLTTGKLEGKRAPGRQRQKMLDSVTEWLGTEKNNITIQRTQERVEWRALIANAVKHGTQ